MSKKLSNFFSAGGKKKFSPPVTTGSDAPDPTEKQRQDQDEAEEINAIKNSEWCTVEHEILTGDQQKEAEARQQVLEKNAVAQPTRKLFTGWATAKDKEKEETSDTSVETPVAPTPPPRPQAYKAPAHREGFVRPPRTEEFPELGQIQAQTAPAKPSKAKPSHSIAQDTAQGSKPKLPPLEPKLGSVEPIADIPADAVELSYEELLAPLKKMAEAYSKIEMNMGVAKIKYRNMELPEIESTG